MRWLIMIFFFAGCGDKNMPDKNTLAKNSVSNGKQLAKCLINKNSDITSKDARITMIDNYNQENIINNLMENCTWGEINEITKHYDCLASKCKNTANFGYSDITLITNNWKKECNDLIISENCQKIITNLEQNMHYSY